MRRKNCRHAQKTQIVPEKSKSRKPLFKRTYMKVLSFCFALVIAGAVLIVPGMSLAPDVEAIANQKEIAFGIGSLKNFAGVISENCSEEAKTFETEPETEAPAETEPETESVTEPPVTEPETEPVTEPETEPSTEPQTEPVTEEPKTSSQIVSQVGESVSKSEYLLAISNPDPNYAPGTVALSDEDRDLLERLVMGEAGSLGYTGCALVAQAIKDTMVFEGNASVADIIAEYNYSASTSVKPNSAAVSAVSYVFDQNGSAVQHRIMYFYQSSICSSKWHETQNFIIDYNGVRFFDRW